MSGLNLNTTDGSIFNANQQVIMSVRKIEYLIRLRDHWLIRIYPQVGQVIKYIRLNTFFMCCKLDARADVLVINITGIE